MFSLGLTVAACPVAAGGFNKGFTVTLAVVSIVFGSPDGALKVDNEDILLDS